MRFKWNTEYNRGQIDNKFRSDMGIICDGKIIGLRTHCRSWALTYYTAVRNGGASHFR
ncbi:phospholipase A2 [Catellatospora sp. TT07R-123]|uniref:phospholipase A2 n=1 Tax=Catellatospora sp. TT07R-123 TaxID=2733863 RepID=UPI001BB43964|nr:phospholipase A2 [Catellatospora sp. TT07R-123]